MSLIWLWIKFRFWKITKIRSSSLGFLDGWMMNLQISSPKVWLKFTFLLLVLLTILCARLPDVSTTKKRRRKNVAYQVRFLYFYIVTTEHHARTLSFPSAFTILYYVSNWLAHYTYNRIEQYSEYIKKKFQMTLWNVKPNKSSMKSYTRNIFSVELFISFFFFIFSRVDWR